MLDRLETLRTETLAQIEAAADVDDLKRLETRTLGQRTGEVTQILRSIRDLPPAERPQVGQRANEVRRALEAAFAARQAVLEAQVLEKQLRQGAIDVTLPGRPVPVGRLHPITRTLRQIYAIWAEMGFQVYRSQDVEDDDTNFTLLNLPPHHPARDMQDTFHTTEEGIILRTHTSPGQIRAMREYAPEPIRVILPGMCYRYEQVSVRYDVQFYQVEGLAVGRNIRMSDLKGSLAAFARRFFGAGVQMRYRASYFPFTEPGMEVDVACILCEGAGCDVCKHTGWIEIGGAGMVHPVVLRNGGYDPARFTGFAFGMGPDRATMNKHGIGDIRSFWRNDLRFLAQL